MVQKKQTKLYKRIRIIFLNLFTNLEMKLGLITFIMVFFLSKCKAFLVKPLRNSMTTRYLSSCSLPYKPVQQYTMFNNSIHYDTTYFHNFHINQVVEGLALDVSCKSGETTKLLAMKYPDLKTIGIDQNSNYIKLAKYKFQNTEFFHLDFESTHYVRSESFKVIQISDYDNIYIVFDRAIHALEKGGMILFKVKTEEDKSYLYNAIRNTSFSPRSNEISFHYDGNTFFIFKSI
jgi:precorrin-6B methylase 2